MVKVPVRATIVNDGDVDLSDVKLEDFNEQETILDDLVVGGSRTVDLEFDGDLPATISAYVAAVSPAGKTVNYSATLELDAPAETYQLELQISDDAPDSLKLGDEFNIIVTVSNLGTGAISDVVISGGILPDPVALGTIIGGASETVTLEYRITQADVGRGSIQVDLEAAGVQVRVEGSHTIPVTIAGSDQVMITRSEKDGILESDGTQLTEQYCVSGCVNPTYRWEVRIDPADGEPGSGEWTPVESFNDLPCVNLYIDFNEETLANRSILPAETDQDFTYYIRGSCDGGKTWARPKQGGSEELKTVVRFNRV